MKQIEILTNALEYIEKHLADSLKTEEIARECYCSKVTLEKIFRCINNISVHDYITRRRMTCAGRMLLGEPEKRILDIAMEFGFTSNESFTRTFKQILNCNPSEFRKLGKFPDVFPKYVGYASITQGGNQMFERKNVDISELYDLFSSRRGCYFVSGDIKNMIGFNNISRKTGDLAILEALKRMNDEAGEEDYVFRIGADEFVMLTASQEESYATEIAERIKSHNDETFSYDGQEIPLSMYVGIMQFNQKSVQYKELYDELHSTIMKTKEVSK